MEYPDVAVAYCHIDAATIYLVTDPGRFDVIVTDNLFGDIITDLAARGHRWHRARRQRQHRRLAAPTRQHVRAGARLRAGHRRPGHRRPDRRGPVGGAAAATTSGARSDAARIEQAVEADLAPR